MLSNCAYPSFSHNSAGNSWQPWIIPTTQSLVLSATPCTTGSLPKFWTPSATTPLPDDSIHASCVRRTITLLHYLPVTSRVFWFMRSPSPFSVYSCSFNCQGLPHSFLIRTVFSQHFNTLLSMIHHHTFNRRRSFTLRTRLVANNFLCSACVFARMVLLQSNQQVMVVFAA